MSSSSNVATPAPSLQYTTPMKTSPPIKTKIPRLSPHLVAASFLALSLIPTPSVRAQSLYWDGTDLENGGAGDWNTSNLNWDTSAPGGINSAWSNGKTAVFGGTQGGAVTLGTNITVGGLQFDTSGYTVLNGGNALNTLTFGANGDIFVNDNQAATISSVITATAGTQITKTGSGTLTLSGLNTFNTFSISAGTVKSGSVNALGVTGNKITIETNAVWDLNGYNTSGQTSLNGGGNVTNSRTGNTSQTNLNLGGIDGTFTGKILQTSGNIISVTKAGGGTQILTSTENTFTGTLIIANQSLIVASLGKGTGINEIGSNGSGNISMGNVQNDANLTYTGSGVADASTRNIQLYGNATGGKIEVDSSSSNGLGTGTLKLGGAFASQTDSLGVNKRLTLKGTNTGANTMTGVISNYKDGISVGQNGSGNVLSLTKSGTGTWVLAGNNTYTGDTTVSEGKLLINGNQSAATGAVSVDSGATLGGTGTVGGATTIDRGAFLAAGNSLGSLTFTRSLTLNDGSTTTMELAGNGGVAGTHFDKITVGGAITFNGTLNIVSFAGYNFNQTASYDLFDFVSRLGDFDFVSVGATTLSLSGNFWTGTNDLYTYSFNQLNGVLSVTLSAIPEPASYAALAGLGILGFAVYRRRPKA